MNTTINQIDAEFRAIFTAHLFLNDYYWGDFQQAVQKERLYPLMCAFYINGGGASSKATTINLVVVIADKTYKNDSNLTETESDTLQICKDILNIVSKSTRWQRMGRVNSHTFNKFIQRGPDETAGHVLQINFSIKDPATLCGLPLQGYDFGGDVSPLCKGVLVTDTDGQTIYEIPSGGSFSCSPPEPGQVDAEALNSDSEIIATATLTPENNQISIPDTPVEVIDQFGDVLGSGQLPSGTGGALMVTVSGYPNMFAPGVYVPKNSGSPLVWENATSEMVTGDGVATCNAGSGFVHGASFKVNHHGDFRLDFNITSENLIPGISYYKDPLKPFNTYEGIDHSILFQGATYYIFGKGFVHYQTSAFPISSLFTIRRQGTTIEYLIDDNLQYSQNADFQSAFNFDCSMGAVGAITNITLTIP